MKSALQEVKDHQAQLQRTVETAASASERRAQETATFVQESMVALKSDVEKSVSSALKQQADTLNTNLSEMKQLILQQVNKRPRKDVEEMSEDD